MQGNDGDNQSKLQMRCKVMMVTILGTSPALKKEQIYLMNKTKRPFMCIEMKT
jgi:hypothetical protein